MMPMSQPQADSDEFGPRVDPTPAPRPGPVTLSGRYCTVVRLDAARHGADLWEAVHGRDQIWDYLSYGPYPDAAAFADWLASREASPDPFYYAILNAAGRTIGLSTLVNIHPAMRTIEVGHILYSPALQRTPLATEAHYLLARYNYLRKELEKARVYAEKVRQARPAHAELRNLLGLIYVGLNQPGKARDEFQAAVRLAPERADFRENLQKLERQRLRE